MLHCHQLHAYFLNILIDNQSQCRTGVDVTKNDLIQCLIFIFEVWLCLLHCCHQRSPSWLVSYPVRMLGSTEWHHSFFILSRRILCSLLFSNTWLVRVIIMETFQIQGTFSPWITVSFTFTCRVKHSTKTYQIKALAYSHLQHTIITLLSLNSSLVKHGRSIQKTSKSRWCNNVHNAMLVRWCWGIWKTSLSRQPWTDVCNTSLVRNGGIVFNTLWMQDCMVNNLSKTG